MSELHFGVRGAADVIAAQEAIAKQQDKQRSAVQALNKEYAANETELRKLGRIAAQVYRDNETSTEKYKRQLAQTKAALQGNVNETELLKRATTSLTVEYLRQLDGNKKLTDAEQHKLEVKRKYREQLDHEIQIMPRLVSETHKLMGEYTQTGVALDNVTRKSKSFFSEATLSNITKFATKLSTIMAPLVGFANAIEEGDNRLRKYGGQAITAAKAGGGLAQLAGGDAQKLRALYGASKQSYGEGGFESLADAHRLTFELESGGILGDRPFLSRLQAASVDDAAQVAKNTSLVAAAFGRREAGNTEQLTSKGLAAAGPATGANLGDILQGVASAAAAAKPLGLSDEEVFALVSRIAEVTGSGTEAGTRAEALFRSLTRKGFADDPRAPLREQIGKSDTKLEGLRKRLAQEEKSAAGGRDQQMAAYNASEAKRRAAFDTQETERLARLDEQLDDAQESLRRGQEDLRESETPYGRRGAQRRIADARKRIERIQADRKPRAYQPAESPAATTSKTLANLRQEIAAETTNRDALQAQLQATGPRQKLSLGQMLGQVGKMGLEQSGLIEFLGRQEAAQAFDIARDVPAYERRLTEINAAQRSGLANKVIDSALAMPDVATRRQVNAEKADAALTLEEQALRRERIDAYNESERATWQQQGGKVPAWMLDKLMNGGSMFGLPLPGINTFVPDAWEDPGIYGQRAAAVGDRYNDMDEMARSIDQQNKIAADSLKLQQQALAVFNLMLQKLSEAGIPIGGE